MIFSIAILGGCSSSVSQQEKSKDPGTGPTEPLYQSKDFTKAGEFTEGIEGPACDIDGNVYAVNYDHEGTIGIVQSDGKASVFVELPAGSTGNGIRFDTRGRMFIADYSGHNVLLIDPGSTTVKVFGHESTMNQPNDIAIMRNGILFASDPNWNRSSGNLWRVDTTGKMNLVESSMGTTNGIEVSMDEKYLYVNESNQRNVWRYDLDEKGILSNKTLFIAFPDFGLDGMRCDSKGNLYVTRYGKGVVAVVSPDGKVVREIVLNGNNPTNIAFGGPDGCTAYVTMQDRRVIQTFRIDFPGREWYFQHP